LKTFLFVTVVLFAHPSFGTAAEPVVLTDEIDRESYSLGYQIGSDLKSQGEDLDPETILAGFRDGMSGRKPGVDADEMKSILVEFKSASLARKRSAHAIRREEKQGSREAYHAEDQEFLSANAAREGVVSLPSGLQYRVIREGGGATPKLRDTVEINYRGTRTDGSPFGSSDRPDKPKTFAVSALIPGLTEAVLLMREGARWEVVIPPHLGFPTRGPLGERVVVYDIELLSVTGTN